jgi:molecular chaperone DnaJ
MTTHKLYEDLEISKDASAEDIKKAYRNLARKYHPDKGGDSEKFKAISNAYHVLGNEEARQRYDSMGDEMFFANGNAGADGPGGGAGGFPMNGFDAFSMFEELFGGRGGGGSGFNPFGGGGGHQQTSNRKCKDHRHIWQLTLDEAYKGMKKTLKVVITKNCMGCMVSCYACQGRGQVTDLIRNGFITQMMTRKCGTCNGSGMECKPRPNAANVVAKACPKKSTSWKSTRPQV